MTIVINIDIIMVVIVVAIGFAYPCIILYLFFFFCLLYYTNFRSFCLGFDLGKNKNNRPNRNKRQEAFWCIFLLEQHEEVKKKKGKRKKKRGKRKKENINIKPTYGIDH